MKRLVVRFVAVCLCALFLAGCARKQEAAPSESAEASSFATVASAATVSTAGSDPGTFEPIIAADNDQCAIRLTSIDPDARLGYTIGVEMENKSSQLTYLFAVSGAAVNGVQTDPFFAMEVAPGKKAVARITFSDEKLAENGITEFTDIELTFRVFDQDDALAPPVAEETVHVYPCGKDNAAVFVRPPQDTDQVILDNEFVTATVVGYAWDSFWGYEVKVFLENKTD